MGQCRGSERSLPRFLQCELEYTSYPQLSSNVDYTEGVMLLLYLLFLSSTASLIDLAMYSSWVSSKLPGYGVKSTDISR